MKPSCIAISGSDPTCGAGAQLDIQVLSHLGVVPLSVITAITVQNADQFKGYWSVPSNAVAEQIEILIDSYEPKVCKIGMLPEEALKAVLNVVNSSKLKCPIILDPILKSSSGYSFINPNLLKPFFKYCYLITPNIPEIETFLGTKVANVNDMEKATIEFANSYSCPRVLLKGGHFSDTKGLDVLYSEGRIRHFENKNLVENKEIHGTGCFLSTAIAGYLSLDRDLESSIELAKSLLCLFMDKSYSLSKDERKIFSFFKGK